MRPLIWVGSSLTDLKAFPEEVRQIIGYALFLAQVGDKHLNAKPLKGFSGAGVLEVAEDYAGDTYRAVYTVRLPDAIYVLQAFQKKAKQGIATPQREMDLVRTRLQRAREISAERSKAREELGS